MATGRLHARERPDAGSCPVARAQYNGYRQEKSMLRRSSNIQLTDVAAAVELNVAIGGMRGESRAHLVAIRLHRVARGAICAAKWRWAYNAANAGASASRSAVIRSVQCIAKLIFACRVITYAGLSQARVSRRTRNASRTSQSLHTVGRSVDQADHWPSIRRGTSSSPSVSGQRTH